MNQLDQLIETYLTSSAARPEVLFRDFLITGYRATTLSSVPRDLSELVIFAKVHVGMIITLYDDLADNPKYRNPDLLQKLYSLNVGRDLQTPSELSSEDKKTFELARFLFQQLDSVIQKLPNYQVLLPALRFDIEQFYACNRHSELMMVLPEVRNISESQTLGAHNMGMVAAGIIDLMGSPEFDLSELGVSREVLLLGQRLGRISNLIFTLQREVDEGDFTNEILIAEKIHEAHDYQSRLLAEFEEKQNAIQKTQLKGFSVGQYAKGLEDLHHLYSRLEGKI